MEQSSNHIDNDVNDSIDDARVTGTDLGLVVENGVKVGARVSGNELGLVVEDSEKVLLESSSVAVVTSVPLSDSVNDSDRVKTGDELVETLRMETSIKEDGDVVAQDKIDDVRGSDAAVLSALVSNSDIDASNGVKIVAELVKSKTDTPMMEPSSKEGGVIVARASTDDDRVSGDEIVIKTDENRVNVDEEKEGEYKVMDLVWAKVKNYPWWPGQIFDPSAATDKAKKYSNKKAFLIAYFGDQSFAWNKASNIKPFRKNFIKMEKQSNSIPFHHAVNCALDEVYRRVEFGLACSCLSEEVVNKSKSQVFVNAGITKEAGRIDGGDRFSTVATFEPVNAVQSLQGLARDYFNGVSRLEALSVKAQLLAYLRWKGYNQFTTQQLEGLDNKLEDDFELQLMEEDKMVEDEKPDSVSEKVSSKKRKLKSGDNGSRKQQHVSSNDSVPSKKEKVSSNVSPARSPRVFKRKNKSEKNDGKKEKRLKDVTSTGSPSLLKREDRSEKKSGKKEKCVADVTPIESISVFKRKNISEKNSGKKTTAEGKGLKEEKRNETVDQKATNSTPKKLFIGDKICRIAKQLSKSPSNL